MNQIHPTLVIGASNNPERYAYKAMEMLKEFHHPIFALGKKSLIVNDIQIETDAKVFDQVNIDTVTLYINPSLQEKYYEDIIKWQPKRVIFNPGTENEAFQTMLDDHNIQYTEACTLVLLRTGQY